MKVSPQASLSLISLFLGICWAEKNSEAPISGRSTWTDKTGRSMEAVVKSVENEHVVFMRLGKEYRFPINRLSPQDQQRLRSRADAKANTEKAVSANNQSASEDKSSGFDVPTEGAHYITGEPLIYPHNFEAPFPKLINAGDFEVIIIQEDDVNLEYIYETNHFQFISNVPLKKTVIREFAKLFEATFNYIKELPFGFPYPANQLSEGKYKTMLYDTVQQYRDAGGPRMSAGVYFNSTDTIHIPLESLGVKRGASGYYLDRSRESDILVHEIVHQLTLNRGLNRPPNWWVEGFAEYVDYTPVTNGTFKISRKKKAIVKRLSRWFKYLEKEKDIYLPEFKMYFQTHRWNRKDDTYNSTIYYGLGALLVYYFCHADGEGDGQAMRDYMVELRKGTKYLDAEGLLLRGRTHQELQVEFVKYWKKQGLELNFPEN